MAPHRLLLTGTALLALAACEDFDFDLRDRADGFDTTAAVQSLPARPTPDDRGVISYPNYQVVVARSGDTIRTIADRLNLDAGTLARFNGIEPDVRLNPNELVALPSRVTEPSPATGASVTGPITPLNVEEIATTALDGLEPEPAPTTPATVATTPPTPSNAGIEPLRHQVQRGETVYQISRQYNIPVQKIAEWNGLGPDLAVRAGQFLLIPQAGATRPVITAPVPTVTAPAPTPTPDPAPAPAPTPEPEPEPTPEPTANNSAATLIYPVDGSILRGYGNGNEGIDIAASAGTNVRAADGGTVAAVTTDTNGSSIVVLRHDGGLLTVYTQMENVTVGKSDRVAKGDNLGKVKDGSPSFLHFEVRRGLQSVDPTDLLP